jgi:NAD dependent epimerase/dehydratase family enzyme
MLESFLPTYSESIDNSILMKRKIVIAGGAGFVGKYLARHFAELGYQVIIISRQKDSIQWHDNTGIISAIENSEMLINLAGKSVDCRYNEKNRKGILESRTETTRVLGEAPNPTDNKTLMKTLREIMHMPIGLPSPEWLLKMGLSLSKQKLNSF